jgi:hypothetical protein
LRPRKRATYFSKLLRTPRLFRALGTGSFPAGAHAPTTDFGAVLRLPRSSSLHRSAATPCRHFVAFAQVWLAVDHWQTPRCGEEAAERLPNSLDRYIRSASKLGDLVANAFSRQLVPVEYIDWPIHDGLLLVVFHPS